MSCWKTEFKDKFGCKKTMFFFSMFFFSTIDNFQFSFQELSDEALTFPFNSLDVIIVAALTCIFLILE